MTGLYLEDLGSLWKIWVSRKQKQSLPAEFTVCAVILGSCYQSSLVMCWGGKQTSLQIPLSLLPQGC